MNKKIPPEHVRESQKITEESNVCFGFKRSTGTENMAIPVIRVWERK